jgi:hypothetical protein
MVRRNAASSTGPTPPLIAIILSRLQPGRRKMVQGVDLKDCHA